MVATVAMPRSELNLIHTTTSRVSTHFRIRDILVSVDHVCAECNRLLEDYAEAIKAHIRLTGQEQVAAIQQRSGVLIELEPLVRDASEQRATARQAFKEHVATHQSPGERSEAVTA
jgi:hypothetical protein